MGSLLIPLGVVGAGYGVNVALQDRAAKQKAVEIAVSVLQSNNQNNPELRAWALRVFNDTLTSASRSLPPGAVKELERSPLPSPPTNASGMGLVSEFEGFNPKPVQDAFGAWTIGFGHTKGVTADTAPITLEEAKNLLAEDLKQANFAIGNLVKVPLTPNQREALIAH